MIQSSSVAGRVYARALFEIAEDQRSIGEVWDNLSQLGDLYRDNREFRDFFTSPKVESAHKMDAIRDALAESLNKQVLNLLMVLIKKNREAYLDNIVDAFARYKDDAEKRVHVEILSATPITDRERTDIRYRLQAKLGEDVAIEMHEQIDKSLIGGVVLRVGDRVIDGSLKKRFEKLKMALRVEG